MINKPTRPGCAMCGSDRPSTYVIPSNYKLSDDELKRIEQEEAQEKALREVAILGHAVFIYIYFFFHVKRLSLLTT